MQAWQQWVTQELLWLEADQFLEDLGLQECTSCGLVSETPL